MREEKNYSKREQDTFRAEVLEALGRIEKQVQYTNGKVKKIILAMVALAFFCLGLGITDIHAILALITAL